MEVVDFFMSIHTDVLGQIKDNDSPFLRGLFFIFYILFLIGIVGLLIVLGIYDWRIPVGIFALLFLIQVIIWTGHWVKSL